MIALIVLLLILVIGYTMQALRDGEADTDDRSTASTVLSASSTPVPAVTTPAGPTPAGPTPATSTQATSTQASSTPASHGLPGSVTLSSLPAPARATVALIRSGGPFPYPRDGAVFRNAERHLPGKPSGYYHEYTVTTPGEPDRGARRVVTGQGGEFYYTGDHYETFVGVDATR